jgi:hypothetical protein
LQRVALAPAHLHSSCESLLTVWPGDRSLICGCRGAALWTAVVAKDAWLKIVKVEHGNALGIYVTAGPALCTCLVIRSSALSDAMQISHGLHSSLRPSPFCPTWSLAVPSAAANDTSALASDDFLPYVPLYGLFHMLDMTRLAFQQVCKRSRRRNFPNTLVVYSSVSP